LREALGEFFVEQIHNADVVILNKIDLASAADLDTVGGEVSRLNQQAEILFSERCEVDVRRLFEGRSSVVDAYLKVRGIDRAPARESGHDHDHDHNHDHEHGDKSHLHAPAQSFVLDACGEASLTGVEAFFRGLPENVWRAKGFMQADGRPVLVQFSMGQLEITPAEPRTMRHMVFIGRDMDRPAIEKGFGALLSSPGEGAARAQARGSRR
jgi:G3E family GTPase